MTKKEIVLGIRSTTTEIRYAIIDQNNNTMLNLSDHRVKIEQNLSNAEIFQWVYKEVDEITNQYKIDRAVIKENAYIRENKSVRLSNQLDAIILLALANKNIPSEIQLLILREEKLLALAETKVGKTDTYWNKDIASCIVVAVGS